LFKPKKQKNRGRKTAVRRKVWPTQVVEEPEPEQESHPKRAQQLRQKKKKNRRRRRKTGRRRRRTKGEAQTIKTRKRVPRRDSK